MRKQMVIQKKHKISLLGLGILVAALIVFGGLYQNQPDAKAANINNFDPGNIISDYMMSRYQSMNEAQIQAFMESKNACNNTNIHWADQYPNLSYHIENGKFVCMHEEDFNGESAAHIIWQAAQDYQINPQVLLVLLQKEQALVTDDWPNNIQYRHATGFGCPDTAPCDQQYYGFKNQVRHAAALFREVLDGGWTNYPPGWRYVRYHPNSSCGGKTIHIKNRATSSLYRYTPYQPNQAALNAGYGGGAHCGAYGNRNFWLYFNDWFGSSIRTVSPFKISSQIKIYSSNGQEITNGRLYRGNTYTIKYSLTNRSYQTMTLPRHGITGYDGSKYRAITDWHDAVDIEPDEAYQFVGTYTPSDNSRLSLYINYYDPDLKTWMGAYKIPAEDSSIKRVIKVRNYTPVSISSQLRIYSSNGQEITNGRLYRGNTYTLKYSIRNRSHQTVTLPRHGVTAYNGSRYESITDWHDAVDIAQGDNYQFVGTYTPTTNSRLNMYINYYDSDLETWMGANKIPADSSSIKRIIRVRVT